MFAANSNKNTHTRSGSIDVNAPISQFDQEGFVLAVGSFEMYHGIDFPDEFLPDNRKTLRQLADGIQLLQVDGRRIPEEAHAYEGSVSVGCG